VKAACSARSTLPAVVMVTPWNSPSAVALISACQSKPVVAMHCVISP
jgi:hypothetical protein